MAKSKSLRHYTSKGQRPNVSKKYKAKKDISKPEDSFWANVRRFDSYISGKHNVSVTINNGGINRVREPLKRVLAKEHYNNTLGTSEEGKHKKDVYLMNRYFKMPNHQGLPEGNKQ